MLDRLGDIMTFGALVRCKVCNNGQLVFDKFGYRCRGNLTEWTTCQTEVREPERKRFKVPSDLAEKYPFLGKYKYVPRKRVVKVNPNPDVKKEEEENGRYVRVLKKYSTNIFFFIFQKLL